MLKVPSIAKNKQIAMENNYGYSAEKIKNIEKDFRSEVENIFAVAKKPPKGGGEEWLSLILDYGVSPLSEAHRNEVSLQIPTMVAAAYPAEVRMVLDKIVAKYLSILEKINNDSTLKDNFEVSDALYDANFFFSHRLDISFEMNRYYSMIKAPVSLGNIFANAASSMNTYSYGLKESRTDTIRCKNCGAPRLKENQYDFCMFCGSNLFTNTNRYE
jgi:hypothetical protein